MGGSRRRRPYAAFLPLSLRCLLQLPPQLFSSSSSVGSFVRSFEALNPTPTPPDRAWVPSLGSKRRKKSVGRL